MDPRLIVQKSVIGPDENHLEYHGFIDSEGGVRGEFVGRKLRLAPAHYGSGTYVESVHAEDARQLGRAVLQSLGYRGMAHLDLKRDDRDGRLYLFEINPRFSIWTALDVACGVNLPFYYFQASLGQPFEVPTSYPAGRRWLNPAPDLGAMREYVRDGTWSRQRWLASILRSSVNAVFARDDPSRHGRSWRSGSALASRAAAWSLSQTCECGNGRGGTRTTWTRWTTIRSRSG